MIAFNPPGSFPYARITVVCWLPFLCTASLVPTRFGCSLLPCFRFVPGSFCSGKPRKSELAKSRSRVVFSARRVALSLHQHSSYSKTFIVVSLNEGLSWGTNALILKYITLKKYTRALWNILDGNDIDYTTVMCNLWCFVLSLTEPIERYNTKGRQLGFQAYSFPDGFDRWKYLFMQTQATSVFN